MSYDEKREPVVVDEAGAMRILEAVFNDPAAPPLELFPATVSLGNALDEYRRAHGWTAKRLAFALGIPQEKMHNLLVDADLPDLDEMHRICSLLGESPIRVLPKISESARRTLREALEQAEGRPRAMVARRRGTPGGDPDELLVANVPNAVRRALAYDFRVSEDDIPALAAGLRKEAAGTEEDRKIFVHGVVAILLLDGDDTELPPGF